MGAERGDAEDDCRGVEEAAEVNHLYSIEDKPEKYFRTGLVCAVWRGFGSAAFRRAACPL